MCPGSPMAASSRRPSPRAASRASMRAKPSGSRACSASSPMKTGRPWPRPTRATRTMSPRRRVRRSARSTTTRCCSAASRLRWSWRRSGKSPSLRLRSCVSNTSRRRMSRIFSPNAIGLSSSRSPRSRAAMRRRLMPPPPCATRRNISFRPNTIIRWSFMPPPRSGTAAASSPSTTRPRACRTCSATCAACSR